MSGDAAKLKGRRSYEERKTVGQEARGTQRTLGEVLRRNRRCQESWHTTVISNSGLGFTNFPRLQLTIATILRRWHHSFSCCHDPSFPCTSCSSTSWLLYPSRCPNQVTDVSRIAIPQVSLVTTSLSEFMTDSFWHSIRQVSTGSPFPHSKCQYE